LTPRHSKAGGPEVSRQELDGEGDDQHDAGDEEQNADHERTQPPQWRISRGQRVEWIK
jgi:hypothetical protein